MEWDWSRRRLYCLEWWVSWEWINNSKLTSLLKHCSRLDCLDEFMAEWQKTAGKCFHEYGWLYTLNLNQFLLKYTLNNEENSHYIQGKTSSSWQHEYSLVLYSNPLTPDQICNSPYCQPYNSYNVSSENLVLVQQIIPKLTFFFILITYLVDIVLIL